MADCLFLICLACFFKREGESPYDESETEEREVKEEEDEGEICGCFDEQSNEGSIEIERELVE